MNTPLLVFFLVTFFLLEVLFFNFCFRWLSKGKELRAKEFAILDAERAELLSLQKQLLTDIREARQTAQGNMSKLVQMSTDATLEWEQLQKNIRIMNVEHEQHIQNVFHENAALVQRQRLALEQLCRQAEQHSQELDIATQKSNKLLRLFDKSVPSEIVYQEIQAEKYSEAKKLIESGQNASEVAKKLGLSLGEINFLSHTML